MRVIYNGIDLFPLETHEFSAEPVYDDSGTDYLYTRFSLYVTAVVTGFGRVLVNGPQMSYRFGTGVVGDTPAIQRDPSKRTGDIGFGRSDGITVGSENSTPRVVEFTESTVPLTIQAVRHRLSTPRGPLYVFSGGGFEVGNPIGGFAPPKFPVAELILSSPQEPFEVDCKNGPTPKKFDVIAAMGDTQTLLAEFAIETYVNEAEQNNARPYGALLSHRWKQSHSVDENGFTTINTQGLALFRTDYIYQEGTSPDVFRPFLFMPIQQAFVRKIDYVEGREDVTGVAYGYTDTQVPVNFVAGPFVSASAITAVHRQAVSYEVDPLGKMVELGERLIGTLTNLSFLKGNLTGGVGKPSKSPMDMKKLASGS